MSCWISGMCQRLCWVPWTSSMWGLRYSGTCPKLLSCWAKAQSLPSWPGSSSASAPCWFCPSLLPVATWTNSTGQGPSGRRLPSARSQSKGPHRAVGRGPWEETQAVHFVRKTTERMLCCPQHIISGMWYQLVPLRVMLILIMWLREYPLDWFTIKLLFSSFEINNWAA